MEAELTLKEHAKLPFNFELSSAGDGTNQMEIFNAEEVILVDEIEFKGDSIRIQAPVFEGYVTGVFSENEIKGYYIKENQERKMPFRAVFGPAERFPEAKKGKVQVGGIWEMDFDNGSGGTYKGKGILTQKGSKVTGTIRTTTGDYRF